MFKWVVSISVSYHRQDFLFDNAADAESFAKMAFKTMLPYETDKDGAPKMATISIRATFDNEKKEEE